jgi:hypothetical protein
MWKTVFFFLWKVKRGTLSLHREMERPSKQVAWGEGNVSLTPDMNRTQEISLTLGRY